MKDRSPEGLCLKSDILANSEVNEGMGIRESGSSAFQGEEEVALAGVDRGNDVSPLGGSADPGMPGLVSCSRTQAFVLRRTDYKLPGVF